ncbi:MAG: threonylcarbamoyl-AMP synthase [Candidatus Moranbacteria bacterium CG10_big_fil_rev_8_21_14_0_10_35_21]|nr:MAG: threonylcarbamoyl-AMP synthase [Candidatus Moranbacteria bacterium CG10_big_fil_rev_8_21_14_0_10_35_21]PJA88410.1 MAG: threonylcarbamoyl-AMP synthase [Candidatus Moranbacteria bacterium CG_4_9_14_3_um_filter_36_9]
MKKELQKIAEIISSGGVGIIPTDTIYGVVGSAFSKKAVEKIYQLKKRDSQKPFIILISSKKDLNLFGIKLRSGEQRKINKLWPGKVSILLSCPQEKFAYLHRGTGELAFRFPRREELIRMIKITGPLVAPSANPSGKKPSETIEQAKKYFKKEVDFYADGGKLSSLPSALVRISGKNIEIIRQGELKLGK